MSLDFGLSGVHVLISGAAGGIGLVAVKIFLQLGAKVTAHYNSKIGELEQLPGVTAIQADVRNENDVSRLFTEAAKQNGPVSVLVVNHGMRPEKDTFVADMELSQWSNTIAVNLTGSFLLCRAYLASLRNASEAEKAAASITFVGSTAGKFGELGHADYATSKSALMYGLVATLKNEIVDIAPRARVNSVSPGWVATPVKIETLSNVAMVQHALASVPLQKVAQPEDVARQIAVMASPTLSGHVSGLNVQVDGGMEGRLLFPPTLSKP